MIDDPRKPDVVTVLVNRADGGVTVLRVITTEYRKTTAEEMAAGMGVRAATWTIQPTPEYVEGIIAKHEWPAGLQPVSWEFVPNDIVHEATDRYFRNAWKANGKQIEVDMPKAREIQRNRLRAMREPLLVALDTEYLRADEAGDNQEKRRIAEKKRALRDVTDDPAIEAAQTPEGLKAVVPAALR